MFHVTKNMPEKLIFCVVIEIDKLMKHPYNNHIAKARGCFILAPFCYFPMEKQMF